MGQLALVASRDQAEGSISGGRVAERNQAGYQQAAEFPLGTAAVARISPRVGPPTLIQPALGARTPNPAPGSDQAKLPSPDEPLEVAQHGLKAHGVFQDAPGFDDVDQLGIVPSPRRKLIPGDSDRAGNSRL